MKISLALGNREALTPQTARGCAGMNLALPGFGSLMAGRAVGYAQAALTVVAFALTLFSGTKFVIWGLANWSKFQDPEGDPIESLLTLWHHARWPMLGIVLFCVNLFWALGTNASILHSVPKNESTGKPPRLT